MSTHVGPHRQSQAGPVGHVGTRVDIHERPAWAITGWAGVLVVAACIAACFALAGSGWLAAPIVVGVLVASSLMIVQPGQTKVVRFFGTYVGTIRRAGLAQERAHCNEQRRKYSGTHDSERRGRPHATHRSASRRLSHSRIRFQPANVRVTT